MTPITKERALADAAQAVTAKLRYEASQNGMYLTFSVRTAIRVLEHAFGKRPSELDTRLNDEKIDGARMDENGVLVIYRQGSDQ